MPRKFSIWTKWMRIETEGSGTSQLSPDNACSEEASNPQPVEPMHRARVKHALESKERAAVGAPRGKAQLRRHEAR